MTFAHPDFTSYAVLFRGKKYIAAFNFADEPFCRRFIDFVPGQRGKPIAKVAELEIHPVINPWIADSTVL